LVTQVYKIKSTLNIIIIKVLLRFTNKSKFQIGVNKFVIKRWNARGIHHFVWKPIPYINYSNRKIIGASIYSRIWYKKLIRIASRFNDATHSEQMFSRRTDQTYDSLSRLINQPNNKKELITLNRQRLKWINCYTFFQSI